jgi:hypothetical protein
VRLCRRFTAFGNQHPKARVCAQTLGVVAVSGDRRLASEVIPGEWLAGLLYDLAKEFFRFAIPAVMT